jgi:hypothetical protein
MDMPADQNQDPSNYTDASTVNLFYWNNRLHYMFYRLGFNEAAGNFQVDNFGLGGAGGDPVQADAQDQAGLADGDRCNANMGTPGDVRPRECKCSSAGLRTALDNEVIIHEYTHGVHSRLVPLLARREA